MQINAQSLLASQQQVQRTPPGAADFEPIAFKSAPKPPAAAPVQAAPQQKTPAAAPVDTRPVRPGTHLDIKV